MSFKYSQLNLLIDIYSYSDDDLDNLFKIFRRQRIIKYEYVRLDWEEHKTKCLRKNSFTRKYHMQEFTFKALVGCLKERINLE